MTNWGFDDTQNDNQGDPNISGPKALRDAYDAMKKQNTDLQAGLAAIQKDLRDAKIASTFEALGVPGAAPLYQGEADPAKVAEWVATMKQTFGGATPGAPSATPSVPDATLTGDALAQFQRMNDAGQQGSPLGTIEQATANVNDATDLNGLLAAMKFAR